MKKRCRSVFGGGRSRKRRGWLAGWLVARWPSGTSGSLWTAGHLGTRRWVHAKARATLPLSSAPSLAAALGNTHPVATGFADQGLWRCRCCLLRRVVLPRRALVALLAPFRSFRSPLLFPYRTPHIEFQQSWHRRLDSVPVCSPTFFTARPTGFLYEDDGLALVLSSTVWGKGVVRAHRVVASSPDPRVGMPIAQQ